MNINELNTILKEKNIKISGREIAQVWGMDETSYSKKKKIGSDIKLKNIQQLENKLGISLLNNERTLLNAPQIKYFPNVFLSAGYGVEVHDEEYSYVVIDSQFLMSERGMRVDPKNCKLVRISGNSMFPEYHHGDRVIIDESDKNLTDGQIYAFRYDGQCYVKEINRAGNKIKCISVNKDYEPFFIERDVDFQVFGRIIPRVRL